MANVKQKKRVLADEDVRRLVVARLSILSPNTMISLGAEGSFTRDELVAGVKQGSPIGEKLAEIQMEWLRSLSHPWI